MGKVRGQRHVQRRSDAKIDPARVLELRIKNRLSFEAIGKLLGASTSAVHSAVRPLLRVLEQSELGDAYQRNEASILDVLSAKLVENMADPKRLRAASLNNLAFAFSRLHEARRLERDQSTVNVGVRADVVMRAAARRARVELEAGEQPGERPITSIMSNPALEAPDGAAASSSSDQA